MVTEIFGKHMDVGESLQEHVHGKLDSGVKKTLDNITHAKVTFSKHHHVFHAEIVIHDSHMGVIRADNECDDVYSAFDVAVVKIEKQLRKYKGKMSRHAKGIKENPEVSIFSATKYILDMPKDEENIEESEHEPVTIAEIDTKIENLTVSEAIMKMNLAQMQAMLFINKQNGRMNLVYHRLDGNIAWVDPSI
jgi:ribosomal subunit interface protein